MNVAIHLVERMLFALIPLEVFHVLASLTIPGIRSKDVLILMNVRYWKNRVESRPFARMLYQDTIASVHKDFKESRILRSLVSKLMSIFCVKVTLIVPITRNVSKINAFAWTASNRSGPIALTWMNAGHTRICAEHIQYASIHPDLLCAAVKMDM